MTAKDDVLLIQLLRLEAGILGLFVFRRRHSSCPDHHQCCGNLISIP